MDDAACAKSERSMAYYLHSATTAGSAVDYSKGDLEHGVVDSPPSRGARVTPPCSPSPLRGAKRPLCAGLNSAARSVGDEEPECRPQRKLYAMAPSMGTQDMLTGGPCTIGNGMPNRETCLPVPYTKLRTAKKVNLPFESLLLLESYMEHELYLVYSLGCGFSRVSWWRNTKGS